MTALTEAIRKAREELEIAADLHEDAEPSAAADLRAALLLLAHIGRKIEVADNGTDGTDGS